MDYFVNLPLCRLCWSHSAAVHRQRLLLASAGRALLWTIPTLLLIDFLQGQPWCFTKTSESDPPATCQNDNFPRNDCGQWAVKCVHIWIINFCKFARLCWSHSAAVHRQRLLLASAGRALLWTIPTLLLIDFLQGQPWCFTKTSESDPPATCQNDNFPRNDCGQWAVKCVHIWIINFCKFARLCWSHSAAVHRQRLLLASAGRALLWTIPTLLLIDFLQGQPWCFTKTSESDPQATCQNDYFPRSDCGQYNYRLLIVFTF